MAEPATPNDSAGAEGVAVAEAELTEATPMAAAGAPGQIDILLDSVMAVTATLGQAEMPVRELLKLGPGSVVQLDRLIGEPVDLFLRGGCFAKGQLVVVGDRLGVRIHEILSPDPARPGA